MGKWHGVFTSNLLYKAEIVKGILEENNLKPVIIQKQDSLYKIGYFEVHVSEEEVIKAIKIIEDEIDIE
jgi:hypothetical protein